MEVLGKIPVTREFFPDYPFETPWDSLRGNSELIIFFLVTILTVSNFPVLLYKFFVNGALLLLSLSLFLKYSFVNSLIVRSYTIIMEMKTSSLSIDFIVFHSILIMYASLTYQKWGFKIVCTKFFMCIFF